MHAIVIFTKIEGFSQYCLQRNFIKNKNFKNTIESYFNFITFALTRGQL